MKTICYYHSRDLDGWCSAAIVKTKYPDAELIGWDYGDDVPGYFDEKIRYFLVDISFDPLVMQKLRDSNNIFWIDHHKSAIKDSVEYGYALMPGTRDEKYAACELIWKYLFANLDTPLGVYYLGMYDSFRHKSQPNEKQVMFFQYAARAYARGPGACYQFLDPEINLKEYFDAGETILNYLYIDVQEKYKKLGFVWNYGYLENIGTEQSPYNKDRVIRAICINGERINPVNFGIDYHADGYDIAISFWYHNQAWEFSLYNDNGKIDVSEIAKEYGGGGHKGAAGFRVKDPSFFARILTK